jgi:hypothetical protein
VAGGGGGERLRAALHRHVGGDSHGAAGCGRRACVAGLRSIGGVGFAASGDPEVKPRPAISDCLWPGTPIEGGSSWQTLLDLLVT